MLKVSIPSFEVFEPVFYCVKTDISEALKSAGWNPEGFWFSHQRLQDISHCAF